MVRKASSVTRHSFPGRNADGTNTWAGSSPRGRAAGDAVDHPADMAVGVDQLGQILCRQIEACLAGEPDDLVVGWCLGHHTVRLKAMEMRSALPR